MHCGQCVSPVMLKGVKADLQSATGVRVSKVLAR